MICGVRSITHTEPLFKAVHILNVDQVRDYSIRFLCINRWTICCIICLGKCSLRHQMYIIILLDIGYAFVQYPSTKRTQRTIKHHRRKLWNNLCNSIPTNFAFSSLKQKLKTFLMVWHLPLLCDAIAIITVIIIIIFIIIIIASCTLFLLTLYITYSCRLHELGALKSSLLSTLSKLWFHCTSHQLL